ncbi:MAG: glycine cleavage system protein GcvH [Candidatus Sericytochromatia bacterium]|nr:glycine cleavage system protein GcvH [Candidatus Tanganyikabacteria bacterium]
MIRFATSHEYARKEGDRFRVGITPFASEQLGDVVYVELPKVGRAYAAGEEFGVVESVKAVSSLYMPVAGTVVEVNDPVVQDPGLLNTDPMDRGWMVVIESADPSAYDALLTEDAYQTEIASH